MIALCVALHLWGVAAQKVGTNSRLGFGCWNAAFSYNYGCQIELPWNCQCENTDFLATSLACMNMFSKNQHEISGAYQYLIDQCHYWGNKTYTQEDLDTILLQEMPHVLTEMPPDSSEVLQNPVLVHPYVFETQYNAAKNAQYRYFLGEMFGLSMILYWVLVALVAAVANVMTSFNPLVFEHIFGYRIATRWAKLFTLPAVVGNRHHVPHKILGIFSINMPTRGQSIIVAGFLLLNLLVLVCAWDLHQDHPLMYVSNAHKIAHYMATRSGIISVSLIPCIFLFASRNNPLIALTGWGYETFQCYHRWCARMMLLHGLIHGILITWYSFEEKVIIFKWKHVHNWPAGNLGLYFAIIMVIVAFKPIRSRVYEVFLLVHRFLAVGFLVAIIVHCSDYGWLGWIWAALGIYCAEYLFRLRKQAQSGWIQDAEFILCGDDMYRVRTTLKRKWIFSAGQYAYIRILKGSLMYQSHPFSLFKQSAEGGLELMVKGKSGATRAILESLKQDPLHAKTFKVILEGPYGREHNLKDYQSVFILAGGVGITAMYSYAISMAPLLKGGQQLTLLWVLRSEIHLDTFSEEIHKLAELAQTANIQIYLTRAAGPAKQEQKSETSSATIGNLLEDVIYYGRPQIDQELRQAIEASQGSMAVCACGPPSFVDSTRDTIIKNIKISKGSIHYFEEAFSW